MHAYIRYTLLYGVIVALICRKIVKKREQICLNLQITVDSFVIMCYDKVGAVKTPMLTHIA